MNLIEQLVRVYYEEEPWHRTRMSWEEAVNYHTKLVEDGSILCYTELGVLLGYVEVWRINFEQFGRLICKCPFSAYLEDVKSGNIAYVANVWVDKKFRRTAVIKMLKLMFFKYTKDCEYFVGEALRKKTQPVKVFKRENLVSSIFKTGE